MNIFGKCVFVIYCLDWLDDLVGFAHYNPLIYLDMFDGEDFPAHHLVFMIVDQAFMR